MLIATFLLPHEALALEHTFEEVPGLEVEAERIAAHSTTWSMPCLWATSAEFDDVDEALANDPTVEKITGTTEFSDEKHYQLKWSDTVIEQINEYIDREASLLEASANSDGWQVKIRFMSYEQFDVFRERLSEQDCSFQLTRLVEPGAPRQSSGNVTPDQRKALVTAKESGYYRVPRKLTARELAEELDMSHQSLSELLRRGTENLIDTTLTTAGESV